jgi:dihydrofolate reductase
VYVKKEKPMQKLIVFNNITLDGYFTGENGDFNWGYQARPDKEFDAFVAGNAGGGGTLLFGRVTYEMMAGFWPTPLAMKRYPVVAKGMNANPKVVFSRTLEKAGWNNTKLVKSDPAAAIRKMKKAPGKGMAILGSGSLVAQLAPKGLIDEYQIVVNPVALGKGRTMFEGSPVKLALKLSESRVFRNGKVFLRYKPVA